MPRAGDIACCSDATTARRHGADRTGSSLIDEQVGPGDEDVRPTSGVVMNQPSALRLVVLDDYQRAASRFGRWDTIPGDVSVESIEDHIDDRAELAGRLADADVVVAMRERTTIDAPLLDMLPALRLLVTTGPTNAAIDVAAAVERGVVVCGTGGYVTPTSELTWALILAAARRVPNEHAAIRAGGWQHTIGTELAGRTLGLLGLGRIGQLVARVGIAFGMHVIAWSEHLDPELARSVGVTAVERSELFERSDVLSIHLVLSERSVGAVGEGELAMMKPTSILVNTSRGPIVDERALVAAVRDRRIATAALDVFDAEPLSGDHPLRQLDNVVLTPHLGYVTDGLYRLFYDEIAEDVAAWVRGAPVRIVPMPSG